MKNSLSAAFPNPNIAVPKQAGAKSDMVVVAFVYAIDTGKFLLMDETGKKSNRGQGYGRCNQSLVAGKVRYTEDQNGETSLETPYEAMERLIKKRTNLKPVGFSFLDNFQPDYNRHSTTNHVQYFIAYIAEQTMPKLEEGLANPRWTDLQTIFTSRIPKMTGDFMNDFGIRKIRAIARDHGNSIKSGQPNPDVIILDPSAPTPQ